MTVTLPADLRNLAVPVENGQAVQAKVTTVEDRWTLAWCFEGGRRVEPFGEPFEHVRDACRVAAAINERSGLA